MVRQMREEYCPDAMDLVWDPITGRWELRGNVHAAHLYSWRQVEFMETIFGPSTKDEIFSRLNSLFLTPQIEDALDKGYTAIVPDIHLDPQDNQFPRNNLEERNKAFRAWENSKVKEYKVVVLCPKPRGRQYQPMD